MVAKMTESDKQYVLHMLNDSSDVLFTAWKRLATIAERQDLRTGADRWGDGKCE